jgi:ABC transport system ATP-binding/permease protein
MSLLSLRNAHLAFGHWPLLDDANLSIEPLQRIALIGRNGTGKSSLLKILCGSTTPDEGSINSKQGLRMVMAIRSNHRGALS